jgi:hypothetical protein
LPSAGPPYKEFIMPLIAIIIFAFAVLFIGIDQEQLEA